MKILATGIDTLEVGYEISGFKDEELIWALSDGKKTANDDKKEITHFINGKEMSLSYITPKRYDYYLTDGTIQLTISTRLKEEHNYPEIHVKYLSSYLWTTGPEKAYKETDKWIKSWAYITAEKISRADLSIDTECPLPNTKFKQLITRLRTKNDYVMMNHAKGNRESGFTLGMSDIQVRQYGKDDEALEKGKKYFYDIWEKGGRENENKVTRTEFQCNRDFLRSKNINTVPELLESLDSLWKHLTIKRVRICEPTHDTNRARWKNTPLWHDISNYCFGYQRPLEQGPETKYNRDILIKMMRGCMINLQAHGEPLDTTIEAIYTSEDYKEDLLNKKSKYAGVTPHVSLAHTSQGEITP